MLFVFGAETAMKRIGPWLSLLVLALSVRVALLILRPFDGLYGQDAFAYYDYALQLRASLMQGQSVPAFFWPIGFPLHIVSAMALMGATPFAAQLASLIAGVLIAPMTYGLTHEISSTRAAWLAGAATVVSGQLFISSLSIMSDATAALWATLSALCVARYARTLKWRWFTLAVLTLSLATITRWAMAILAVPWTIAVLSTWRQHRTRMNWRPAAFSIVSAGLIGVALIGGQLLSGSHTGDLRVVGWDLANVLRRDVVNTDGTFHYTWPMALYYAEPLFHPTYLSPLLLPLMLIGAWSLRRASGAIKSVLLGWPLIMYVMLIGVAWQNPRFAMAYVPPLAAWAGVGYDALQRRAAQSGWRCALTMLIVIALLGAGLWSYRLTTDFIERKDADLARVESVAADVPTDATVLSFGLTAMLDHYTSLTVREIYNETPVSLTNLLNDSSALYVVIDETNLAAQWAGKTPQINVAWLKQHANFMLIALAEPYTLCRIERWP